MSYSRRPNPKSNWKRPKPKIYDCNARDLENFYQNSYGEYLSAKNDIRARELEREQRGDAEQLTRRFEQRRASSLVYGEDDAPRHHRFIPSRQTSNDGSSEHSYQRTTRVERSELSTDDAPTRDIRSTSSASRNVTFSNSINSTDSSNEMAGIEQRLERLRKLREELGLPSEVGSSGNAASSMNSSFSSSIESGSTRRQASSPEPRGRDRWSKQSASARSDSRSRASPSKSSFDTSSYSSKTEKTSSLRNGFDDQATSNYSTRSSKTQSSGGYGAEGLGNSSFESTSTSTKSRKRVEKPSLDGIDLEFDDDALLTDMRKKLPSSSEILERIRNMDIE